MRGIRIAFCIKCKCLRELNNYILCLHGSVNCCSECGSSNLEQVSTYIPIRDHQQDKREYLLNQMLHGNYKKEFGD